MIYEQNNIYYIKRGYLFYVVDVLVKEHTIVIMPTSKYVNSLDKAKEYSFIKLKRKFGR